MDKWLTKFLDDTLEKGTDKTDSLPDPVSVSGMSVSSSRGPGGNSSGKELVSICEAAENPKPIFWESGGVIVGPGCPEFLAKVGEGPTAAYWVVVQYQGQPGWVNSDLIRSRLEFESQAPLSNKAAEATTDGGPCFSCQSTRRWVSVHGATVCGVCHPPADPGLVERWIE